MRRNTHVLYVPFDIQTGGLWSIARYVLNRISAVAKRYCDSIASDYAKFTLVLLLITEKPGDEELDMLDLAYELTDTSRLGCQIILTKELNGLEVRVPTNINDARS